MAETRQGLNCRRHRERFGRQVGSLFLSRALGVSTLEALGKVMP